MQLSISTHYIKTVVLLAAAILSVTANAQTLRFTSGNVDGSGNAILIIQGPANLYCQIERLNRTNQTWDIVGTFDLGGTGSRTVTNALFEGNYGFFRTKSTNSIYYSTNAFGAVKGALPPGQTMIGNPFDGQNIADVIPDPAPGTTVYRWDNGYLIYTYEMGEWDDTFTLGTGEGIIVRNFSATNMSYLVSSLFTTNMLSKSIPSGFSMLGSHLYTLVNTSSYQVDTLSSTKFGGDSQLPVQSAGFATECEIDRMISTGGTYRRYSFTNSVWLTNGVSTTVPLHLTEGFWINKPSGATWSINRTIW